MVYFREVKRILNPLSQCCIILALLSGILFSQDAPDEFDYNISIYQSFYFFINADLDGEPLVEGEDWIASFNEYDETMDGQCLSIGDDLDGNENTEECQDVNSDGILSESVDVCVGSFVWSGEYTTIPVMGDDGSRWTVGYMKGPEPFVDCNDDLSICSTDDEWDSSMGNDMWDSGEFYTDVNTNGQWDDGDVYYTGLDLGVLREAGDYTFHLIVTDEYGALTKGAVKEYDGKHFVVGRNDIYVFQGNPSNI